MTRLKQFEKYSDVDILSRIAAGEKALYEIIIRRYNPYLFRVGRSYGYNHADTEDLIQETYVSAFFNLDKFEHRSSFKTWLVKIMLNHCYQKKQKFSFQKEIASGDLLRENNRSLGVPDSDNAENAEKLIINRELGHLLENALLAIPEEYRLVFSLRELSGLSTSETAFALNITESNVKVRLSRAKSMLRSEVEKLYSPQEIFELNLIYCDRITEHVMERI